MHRLLAVFLLFLSSLPAVAQIAVQKVTPRVYALVGPLGNRDMLNMGNNATFGAVVTDEGVVLIDAGGSYQGAARLSRAIHTFTDKPVKIVVNTGGQDHRWLGNGYWAEHGARIITSRAAREDQMERASLQLSVLEDLVGPFALKGTEPHYASETFDSVLDIRLGGVALRLRASGGAHTPGDLYVWVPSESTVFAGDIIFAQRILGVLPVSDSANWTRVFEEIDALGAEHVVPGHGEPTDMFGAAADTYDYLVALREAVRAHIDSGGSIMDVGQIDQSDFSYLRNFNQLAGRNAQAVFEAMEWE